MKVDRQQVKLKKFHKESNEEYADTSPQERVSSIWEITAELWSLMNKKNVERRLQRNVAKLIRQ